MATHSNILAWRIPWIEEPGRLQSMGLCISEKADLKLNMQKTKIMTFCPINSWKIDGETMETARDFIFLGSKITADGDCSHEIKRHSLEKSYDKHRQRIKQQRHYFSNKGLYSQSYGFSSSHVWMRELDHKEG